MILSVDLAAKFSAACVMDVRGQVLTEFDSSSMTAKSLAVMLRTTIDDYKVTLVVIEDVPYGIKSQAMVKPVLRLQGIIINELYDYLDFTYFVNPSTWQKTYEGVARGEEKARIEAARKHAESLGYSPPDLIGQYVATLPEGAKVLKKNTNPLAKSMTDYIDAFLMANWANKLPLEELTALSGVQPVFI